MRDKKGRDSRFTIEGSVNLVVARTDGGGSATIRSTGKMMEDGKFVVEFQTPANLRFADFDSLSGVIVGLQYALDALPVDARSASEPPTKTRRLAQAPSTDKANPMVFVETEADDLKDRLKQTSTSLFMRSYLGTSNTLGEGTMSKIARVFPTLFDLVTAPQAAFDEIKLSESSKKKLVGMLQSSNKILNLHMRTKNDKGKNVPDKIKPLKIISRTPKTLKKKLGETKTSTALQSVGITPELSRKIWHTFPTLLDLVTASKKKLDSLNLMEKTKSELLGALKKINSNLELGMKFGITPEPAKKPQPPKKGGDPKKEDLHNVLNEDISVLEKFDLPKKVVENLMAPKGYDMHHIGDLMELSGDDLSTGKTVKEKKRTLKKNEVGLVKSSLAELGKNRQIDLLLGMNRQEWVPPATRDSGTAAQAAAETGQQGPV